MNNIYIIKLTFDQENNNKKKSVKINNLRN